MATVSLNDIKIRLLQLKGLGYDKLLHRDKLNDELEVVHKELQQIDAEVQNLTVMISEAEGQEQPTSDGNPAAKTEQSDEQAAEESDPAQAEQTPPPSHVKVDQQQLTNILSPKSTAGKTTTSKKDDKPKVKKTSHTIGRRS